MSAAIRAAIDGMRTHEFAARVNVASDERTAMLLAAAQPETRALRAALREEGAASAAEVVQQIWRLASAGIDHRYESPWDATLFALLGVMEEMVEEIDVPAALPMSAMLARRAPNTFWTARRAHRILNEVSPVSAGVFSVGMGSPSAGGDRIVFAEVPALGAFTVCVAKSAAASPSGLVSSPAVEPAWPTPDHPGTRWPIAGRACVDTHEPQSGLTEAA